MTAPVVRLAPLLVLLVIAACGGGRVDHEEDGHAPAQDGIVQVPVDAQTSAGFQTAIAARRDVSRTLEAPGVVRPAQNRIAHIRPLARGIIEDIDIQLGDHVRAGDELLEYDNIELGELTGEYSDTLAGLERLEARRNVTERALARAQSLLEIEAISRSEFELRQAEQEQALADIRGQEAMLLQIEEKLHRFGLSEEQVEQLRSGDARSHRTASHSALFAPFDGIVTHFDASVGEVTDRERELFTIVDTSTVWVLADVYEKDLGLVAEGREVIVTVPSYPGQAFPGTIEYVADFLDPASRTAKVRCAVDNREGLLKLEMFGTVRIPVPLVSDAVAVPGAAIQEVQGDPVVFVPVGAEGFQMRPVRVGARGDAWVAILDGLEAGERVVTRGSFQLKSTVLRGSISAEH